MIEDNKIWDDETEDSDESAGVNEAPFDPKLIQVYPKSLVMDLLIRRIRSGALDLHPDFQRSSGVWTKTKQSRLIESLLIRIPIPSFYFDASRDDHWLVVDGLQRLSTVYDFVCGKLKLVNLEFLHNFEGLTYAQLPPQFQMRIDEAEVSCYLIMPGTPLRVKFDIFRRINTGGVQLSQQEIRHALNIGPCTELIRVMAESPEFIRATDGKLSRQRMADRECALRYLVFSTQSHEEYQRKDFNLFLCDFMSDFNRQYAGQDPTAGALREIVERFRAVMSFAHELFGKLAFRKVRSLDDPQRAVNKALFEAWSVNLSELNALERDVLIGRKKDLMDSLILRLNEDEDFLKSVSQGTGDVAMVHKRFRTVQDIIREVMYA